MSTGRRILGETLALVWRSRAASNFQIAAMLIRIGSWGELGNFLARVVVLSRQDRAYLEILYNLKEAHSGR